MELECCRSKWARSGETIRTCGAVYGHMRFSYLPSPEEWVPKSIHTGQRKVEQSVLGTLVPILPVIPECAIGVQCGIRLDTLHVEATVVEAVAVFSGNGDTETV